MSVRNRARPDGAQIGHAHDRSRRVSGAIVPIDAADQPAERPWDPKQRGGREGIVALDLATA